MQIIHSYTEMQKLGTELFQHRLRLGLVPTMGYLHPGHISLLHALNGKCDLKATSIFINPKQFAPNEDYTSYPRDSQRDLELLEHNGCDIVFMPNEADMYPADFQTYVKVKQLSKKLCGKYRPGHFEGVTTIVLRLFQITRCSSAVFGLKDYQQALIIKRMTQDLNLGVELIFAPTIREADGLAMSSRNARLNPLHRQAAARIPQSLETARQMALNGEQSSQTIINIVREVITQDDHLIPQYIEIVDPETLKKRKRIDSKALLAVAVFAGGVRLIDNVIIGAEGTKEAITKLTK